MEGELKVWSMLTGVIGGVSGVTVGSILLSGIRKVICALGWIDCRGGRGFRFMRSSLSGDCEGRWMRGLPGIRNMSGRLCLVRRMTHR